MTTDATPRPSQASQEISNRISSLPVNRVTQVALDIAKESNRYGNKTPWLNEDGVTVWGPVRILVCKCIRNSRFESIMGAVILFNILTIMYEADLMAKCHPDWSDRVPECPHNPDNNFALIQINLGLLILYTVETSAHFFVERKGYFGNRWNMLDFTVVLTGWTSMILGGLVNMAWLRIFRIVRLSRALRIVLTIRELYFLLTGLVSSMKAIFFGAMLLAGMLILSSIIMVEFVHPVNAALDYDGCERCPRGFDSVYASSLTLFQQIIAGDSWGLLSIPVIEADPVKGSLLMLCLVTVSLGVMNLILAVIVESAAEARERDVDEKIKERKETQKSLKADLYALCQSLDTDNSQTVNREELMNAWHNNESFRNMMDLWEISQREMSTLFHILDSGGEGEIDYKEFVEQLYDLRHSDVRLALAMTRRSIKDVESKLNLFMHEWERKSRGGGGEEVPKSLDATVGNHSKLLEAIDTKLTDLTRLNLVSETYAKDTGEMPGGRRSELMEKTDLQISPSSTLTELSFLERRVEELARVEGNLIRKAEEQAQMLQHHAGVLAQARAAFQSTSAQLEGEIGRDKGAQKDIHAVTVGVADIVWRLRRNVQLRLSQGSEGLERCVEEQGVALASQKRLLEALTESFDPSRFVVSDHSQLGPQKVPQASAGPPPNLSPRSRAKGGRALPPSSWREGTPRGGLICCNAGVKAEPPQQIVRGPRPKSWEEQG